MLVHPQFDPVAFQIGPLAVRWYGLMYLVGFGLVWLAARYRIHRHPGGIWTRKDFDDALFYGILGTILGGRLGYVLFYKFGDYVTAPWKIFYLWEGGMSFHGGFLGFDDHHRLVLCHGGTFGFQPRADFDFSDGFTDGRHFQFDGHDFSPKAWAISAACSLLWVFAEPVAGLAEAGRQMPSNGHRPKIRSPNRTRKSYHAPMFCGSS